jgi:transcriptional regulator with XRE-family HTH domain
MRLRTMSTILDIAKLAGVAKSTVSRYLNGGSVGEATKKKIEQDSPIIKTTKPVPIERTYSLGNN